LSQGQVQIRSITSSAIVRLHVRTQRCGLRWQLAEAKRSEDWSEAATPLFGNLPPFKSGVARCASLRSPNNCACGTSGVAEFHFHLVTPIARRDACLSYRTKVVKKGIANQNPKPQIPGDDETLSDRGILIVSMNFSVTRQV
jgi:hypothetical protein